MVAANRKRSSARTVTLTSFCNSSQQSLGKAIHKYSDERGPLDRPVTSNQIGHLG